MAPKSRVAVNVETDDRTVLFPHGNFVTHVLVSGDVPVNAEAKPEVRLEAVYMFNERRAETLIATLELDDAMALSRALLEAVFQGRTQHVLSQGAKIAVVFNPNGFVIRFGEEREGVELFIASPAIVRLAQGIARITDRLLAPAAH